MIAETVLQLGQYDSRDGKTAVTIMLVLKNLCCHVTSVINFFRKVYSFFLKHWYMRMIQK